MISDALSFVAIVVSVISLWQSRKALRHSEADQHRADTPQLSVGKGRRQNDGTYWFSLRNDGPLDLAAVSLAFPGRQHSSGPVVGFEVGSGPEVGPVELGALALHDTRRVTLRLRAPREGGEVALVATCVAEGRDPWRQPVTVFVPIPPRVW